MESVIPKNTLKDAMNEIITPEFTKLTGFVFNYDAQTGENISLFWKYLDISSDWYDSISDFCKDAHDLLMSKKSEFTKYVWEFILNWIEEFWDFFDYYKENFDKMGLFFEALELYIPVEAEKIWKFSDNWNIHWKWWSKQSHIWEIEKIEEQIYWKKISNSPEFTNQALKYIAEKYEKNSTQLTSEEEIVFQNAINKIQQVTTCEMPGIEGPLDREKSEDRVNFDDPLSSIVWLDESILDKVVSREKYTEIFQLAIDILWLKDLKVIVKDNISNISVSPNAINIPSNWDYKTLKVKRIIWLISHELERHAVWNVNNKKLIWNLKSLSYLGQEEWVAHIMEHLALWYSLDSIPLNRYMPRMLAGEILPWDEFKAFLSVMNKLDGQTIDIDTFFARFKRWKDLQLPWVNPKEKLYGMWALECIERLRNCENPLGMFLAKNGSGEQEQINNMILWDSGWKITPKLLHDKEIVLPLMLWELLRFQLVNPWLTEKWMLWGFLKYFNTRYGTLFDSLWISYKDFIRNHIWSNKKENRQKVSQILDILSS